MRILSDCKILIGFIFQFRACAKVGNRSVYFPMNATKPRVFWVTLATSTITSLLPFRFIFSYSRIFLWYLSMQVETADCIKHIDAIAATPGLSCLFLGQNDLCMSMGLYEKVTAILVIHFNALVSTNFLICIPRKSSMRYKSHRTPS